MMFKITSRLCSPASTHFPTRGLGKETFPPRCPCHCFCAHLHAPLSVLRLPLLGVIVGVTSGGVACGWLSLLLQSRPRKPHLVGCAGSHGCLCGLLHLGLWQKIGFGELLPPLQHPLLQNKEQSRRRDRPPSSPPHLPEGLQVAPYFLLDQ